MFILMSIFVRFLDILTKLKLEFLIMLYLAFYTFKINSNVKMDLCWSIYMLENPDFTEGRGGGGD